MSVVAKKLKKRKRAPGAGRKHLPADQVRSRQVIVRFAVAEHEAVTASTHAAGHRYVGAWLRELGLRESTRG